MVEAIGLPLKRREGLHVTYVVPAGKRLGGVFRLPPGERTSKANSHRGRALTPFDFIRAPAGTARTAESSFAFRIA